jgi:hypothetical protein
MLFFSLLRISAASSYVGYDISHPPLKNFEKGFGDIKWNDPSSVLDIDCVRVVSGHEYLGISWFEKISGDLTLGEARLELIRYAFRNDRFKAVLFKAQDEENADLLNEYAHRTFGSPEQNHFLPGTTTKEYWEGGLMYATFENGELGISTRH